MIPTAAIVAIFVVAVAAVIYLIPDRYKPWWEQRRGLGRRNPED